MPILHYKLPWLYKKPLLPPRKLLLVRTPFFGAILEILLKLAPYVKAVQGEELLEPDLIVMHSQLDKKHFVKHFVLDFGFCR